MVTGASGFLGSSLAPRLEGTGPILLVGGRQPITFACRQSQKVALDLRDEASTRAQLDRFKPDLIFHLAALTDVDLCECRPAEAIASNVSITAHLADWIATSSPGTKLVLVSTDQVYDGTGPHQEHVVHPRNVYALSKLGAEAVSMRCARHLILRTNFVGRSPLGRGFADWLVGAMARGEKPTLVDDVLFNPLHADDLCTLMLELALGEANGVFNLGASGPGWSKATFGLRLLDALGISAAPVTIGSIADLSLTARRPLDMRMNVHRVERLLGRTLPNLAQTVDSLSRSFDAIPVLQKHCHG